MRQPEPDFNPCENNGGCEALCLLVPSPNSTGHPTRVCQCPENFILNQDGLTCASNCSSSSFNCKYFLGNIVRTYLQSIVMDIRLRTVTE